MMRTISTRRFEEQKNLAECAILLSRADRASDFEEAVMTVLERHLSLDHFSIFARSPTKETRLMVTGSRRRDGEATEIARTYLARFYRSDDVPRTGFGGEPAKRLFVWSRPAAEVRNSRYRVECYDNHGIGERLTIGSFEFGYWQMLHLYRQRKSPLFDDADVAQALQAAACILTALPHCSRANLVPDKTCDGGQRLESFVRRLRGLPNGLTVREIEVCARALLGMTVEGTAIDLGIGPASVATYRKRAYQKLDITSPNELFALVC